MSKLTYLACPYTHPDKAVMQSRFDAVNKVAGKLMREGHIIYSPITHGHPIAMACDLPVEWEYWSKVDTAYLKASKHMFVLMLDGWETSRGVQHEIEIAKSLGIVVEYLHHEKE